MLADLPQLPQRRRISSSEILSGIAVPKIDRLRTMSSGDFEVMILEWAHGYLAGKYKQVRQYGSSGDKGRDVVGVYADGSIDIYQCKHYDSAIAPTKIYVELGKLCYYTFNGDYKKPLNYYIVAPEGIGSTLRDYIDNPVELRKKLIENWEGYCQKQITNQKEIRLEGDIEKHVASFDFSVVKTKEPLELIEEHSKTIHHPSRFGGGLIKSRDIIPKAASAIDNRELQYTAQLLEVYSEHLSHTIMSTVVLKELSLEYFSEFGEHRDSFYSAESLEKFGRDNFPDANPLPFEELKSEVLSLAKTNLSLKRTDPGYIRMQSSIFEVQKQNFLNSPLKDEMTIVDKKGLCHHLANDNKVKWKI